jgi:hypothetical protein
MCHVGGRTPASSALTISRTVYSLALPPFLARNNQSCPCGTMDGGIETTDGFGDKSRESKIGAFLNLIGLTPVPNARFSKQTAL